MGTHWHTQLHNERSSWTFANIASWSLLPVLSPDSSLEFLPWLLSVMNCDLGPVRWNKLSSQGGFHQHFLSQYQKASQNSISSFLEWKENPTWQTVSMGKLCSKVHEFILSKWGNAYLFSKFSQCIWPIRTNGCASVGTHIYYVYVVVEQGLEACER